MDEKTRTMVEEIEHFLQCNIAGCSRCFKDGVARLDYLTIARELSSAVRTRDSLIAEIVRTQDEMDALSCAGESGKVFERACDRYRAAIERARVHVGLPRSSDSSTTE